MAIPKYREAKEIVEKHLAERFDNVSRQELIPFNESPRIVQHEGKTLKHNTLDNSSKQKTMNYQKVEVNYVIKYEEIPDMKPEDVLAMIDEKAKGVGSQMAKYHYQVINDAAKEVGNVVNSRDKKLSLDLFFETIGKISISFDKDGNPHMPTLVTSSKMADQWKALIKEADNNPEVKARMKALLSEKRKEYDAEQASRKLVD